MSIANINPGAKAPEEVNVLIEIPMNDKPIKYEYDKDSGFLMVDRFMPGAMSYPCNYGFIPNTLSGDKDPIDVLVYTDIAVYPNTLITVKPIGVLITEDENGQDEKILAVPTAKVHQGFKDINAHTDLSEVILKRIAHFFEHYKDLEAGKWVKVKEWGDAAMAKRLITEAIERYKS